MEKRRKLIDDIVSGADEFEVLELDALKSITGGCGPMNTAGCSLNFGCDGATAAAGEL